MLVHNRHSSQCITSTQPVPESFTPSRFTLALRTPLSRAIRAATSSSHLGGCRCLLSILRIVSILLPVVGSAGQASGSNLESSPNHRLSFINCTLPGRTPSSRCRRCLRLHPGVSAALATWFNVLAFLCLRASMHRVSNLRVLPSWWRWRQPVDSRAPSWS